VLQRRPRDPRRNGREPRGRHGGVSEGERDDSVES
jgi:hypothetical protein